MWAECFLIRCLPTDRHACRQEIREQGRKDLLPTERASSKRAASTLFIMSTALTSAPAGSPTTAKVSSIPPPGPVLTTCSPCFGDSHTNRTPRPPPAPATSTTAPAEGAKEPRQASAEDASSHHPSHTSANPYTCTHTGMHACMRPNMRRKTDRYTQYAHHLSPSLHFSQTSAQQLPQHTTYPCLNSHKRLLTAISPVSAPPPPPSLAPSPPAPARGSVAA